ncbi:MAG: ribose-phosphate diphosphokinase [Chloroflexota bacterium]
MPKVPGTRFNDDDYGERVSRMRFGKMKLFCGSASNYLAEEIVSIIGRRDGYENFTLGSAETVTFSNENIFVKLNESVRGKDVYLVSTMASPVHDNIMEMLIAIDALKRDSAWRVNLVVPYLSYTRSDKKDQPRVPISARLMANMIETAGTDRYMTVDLHAGQIQGFFNIPGDALTAFHLLSDYVLRNFDLENLVVVATDLGFAKQGRNWAQILNLPLAFVEKRRVGNNENAKAMSIIGDVAGKNVLLVDDEVNTAGSVVNAMNTVRDAGAKEVSLAFTHAFLADIAYERLKQLELKEIIFTNTLPIDESRRLPNMTTLSVAPLLSEVIIRAHEGRSVGELFDE